MAANTPGQPPRMGPKQAPAQQAPQPHQQSTEPLLAPPSSAVQPQPQRVSMVEGGKVPPYSSSRGKVRAPKHTAAGGDPRQLASNLEAEEQRIKQLTEAVLYEFLPAALNVMLPHCDDPGQELDADHCRAVASAALCVSALMNAPPGFLEFLLCVPWRKLSQLHPSRQDSIDKLISHLHVTAEERRRLVNTRIEALLMPTILDFLYRDDHVDNVPPMLQLPRPATAAAAATADVTGSPSRPMAAGGAVSHGSGGGAAADDAAAAAGGVAVLGVMSQVPLAMGSPAVLAVPLMAAGGSPRGNMSRQADGSAVQGGETLPAPSALALETVAAVLDGATPLHCAALRGNPAQVDHLLYCGADPSLRTAAGELAIELVPVCRDGCRCMCAHDQEVWECRSRLARSLIARRCVLSIRIGLLSWLRLILYCLLCCLGRVGNYLTIARPSIASHVVQRAEAKRHEARERAQGLMARLRSEAAAGRLHLAAAKQECSTQAQSHKAPLDMDVSTLLRQTPMASAPLALHSAAPFASNSTGSSGGGGSPARTTHVGPGPPALSLQGPPPAGGTAAAAAAAAVVFGAGAFPTSPMGTPQQDLSYHMQESEASVSGGAGSSSEAAFKCFVRAVHALQSLDLHGDTMPQVFTDAWELGELGDEETPGTHVLEDEQAELYCCWAESVLIKFKYMSRACSCPGCAALTVQAVRMAHIQATRLFARVDKRRDDQPDRWHAVGQALCRVVYAHMCLLLGTDAQASPTRSSVWRAEQCLREWDKLAAVGLTGPSGEAAVLDPHQVELLQGWSKASDSDLYLAEALLGQQLQPNQTLQEVVAATVGRNAAGTPYLLRTVTSEVVSQLEQAITLACTPSPALAVLARQLTRGATDEMAAAARLRDVVSGRGLPSAAQLGASEGAAALQAALDAAAAFPRLSAEVSAARGLMERWLRRAQAVERLEDVVEDVRLYAHSHPLAVSQQRVSDQGSASSTPATATLGGSSRSSSLSSTAGAALAALAAAATAAVGAPGLLLTSGSRGDVSSSGGDHGTLPGEEGGSSGGGTGQLLGEWEHRVRMLEGAISEAKDANISVNKAKRLLKELQAQWAAAEAYRQLDAGMAKRPAGAGALKAALTRAEAAVAALSGAGGSPGLADLLLPLVQAGRKRLEVEKSAEALYRATAQCRAVGDLPKLEAAILNARKVGAEELDVEAYRSASELRGRLSDAGRARAALEAAVRVMQKQGRPEDGDAVEAALQECDRWEDLLAPEVARAREAVLLWRTQTASEARLAQALRSGVGAAELARGIAEAAAAGVKVAAAKRVLKLLQALDAAAAATADGPAAQYAQLRQRIDAAEQGGVNASVLAVSRRLMRELQLSEAREALEAALRPAASSSGSTHGSLRGGGTAGGGTAGGTAAAASEHALEQRVAALRLAVEKGQELVGVRLDAAAEAAADGGGGESDGDASSSGDGAGGASASASAAGGTTGNMSGGGRSVGAGGGSGGGRRTRRLGSAASSSGATEFAPCSSGGSSTHHLSDNSAPLLWASSSAAATRPASDAGTSRSDAAAGSGTAGGTHAGGTEEAVALLDPAAVAALRELVQRAAAAADAGVAELQRRGRERLAAERTRKEALVREKVDRARAEAERVAREKAEQQERDKVAAEKRDRVKAAQAQVRQQLANKAATAGGGGGGGTVAGGAANGAKPAARPQQQQQQVQQQPGARDAQLPDQARGGGRAVAPPVVRGGRPPVNGAPQGGGRGGGAAAAAGAPAVKAAGGSVLAVPPPVLPPGVMSRQLAAQPSLGDLPPLLSPRIAPPPPPAVRQAPAPPAVLHPLPHFLPVPAAAAGGVGAGGPASPAAGAHASFHMRGDSLEILGDPSLKLNRDMMEALDMCHEVQVTTRSGTAGAANGYSADTGVGGGAHRSLPGSPAPPPGMHTLHHPAGLDGAFSFAAPQHQLGLGWLVTEPGAAGGSLGPDLLPQPAAAVGTALAGRVGLSQRTSSRYSSATSGDDIFMPADSAGCALAAANGGHPHHQHLHHPHPHHDAAGGDSLFSDGRMPRSPPPLLPPSASSADLSARAPRFGFGDLGGASWGVDNPLMTRDSGASLFPAYPGHEYLAGLAPDASGGWATAAVDGGPAGGLQLLGDDAGSLAAYNAAGGTALPSVSFAQLPSSVVLQLLARPGGQAGQLAGQEQQQQLGPDSQQGGLPGHVVSHQQQQQLLQLHRHLQQHQPHQLPLHHPLGGQLPQQQLQPQQQQLQPSYSILHSLGSTPVLPAAPNCGGAAGPAAGLAAGGTLLAGQQGGGTGRSGFWMPPQGYMSLRTAGQAGGLGGGGGDGGGGDLSAKQQQQQQQSGPQYVAVSLPGGGLQLVEVPVPNSTTPTRAASRACRYFLQGYCRDGDRCRFVHSLPQATSLQVMPLHVAPGVMANLQMQQQHQQGGAQQQQPSSIHLLQQAALAAQANGGGGGGGHSGNNHHVMLSRPGGAGGLFAYGAPGSDVFGSRPDPPAAATGATGASGGSFGSSGTGGTTLNADAATFVVGAGAGGGGAAAMSPTAAAGSRSGATHAVQLHNGAVVILPVLVQSPASRRHPQLPLSLSPGCGGGPAPHHGHPSLPDDLSFSPSTSP